jgi:hypothetical protein
VVARCISSSSLHTTANSNERRQNETRKQIDRTRVSYREMHSECWCHDVVAMMGLKGFSFGLCNLRWHWTAMGRSGWLGTRSAWLDPLSAFEHGILFPSLIRRECCASHVSRCHILRNRGAVLRGGKVP